MELLDHVRQIIIDGIQFHDDDAVPNMNNMTEEEIKEYARGVKKLLDKIDLDDEIVEKLVKAVKAKIDIDKAADLLGGLKKLF